jgi:aminopeptidase YwaD
MHHHWFSIDSPGFCEGATDDAAAMGIQTEVARVLLKNFKLNKTILIIGFGGEELWFKGSDDFTKKHPNIVKNCEAMIDLNCVGAGENVFLTGYSYRPKPVKGDPNLLRLLNQSAKELGVPVVTADTIYPSDTYPFFYNKVKTVPVCQVMSQPFKVGPWSTKNTVDKLDLKDIEKVGKTLTMAVVHLTNASPISNSLIM